MRGRLDKVLVERGLASTRSRAKFMISSGVILINGKLVKKSSQVVKKEDIIQIVREVNPWVSRAALKLKYAIEAFKLAPLSGVALDVGASTGGFTEVLLAYGCNKVYAVDVGKGQLASKLRSDSRVLNLEGVNAKNLQELDIPQVDLIVCDASFISFNKVIEVPLLFGKDNSKLIALIKPQFEVERKLVGKGGIVKNNSIHKKVCEDIFQWFSEIFSPDYIKIIESPISGQKGNKEFLIYVKKN